MPIIYLSPSTQDWNQYVTGSGSEEYNMNLLADDLERYLLSNAIRYKRNRPDMTAASSIQEANKSQYDFYLALHSNAAPAGSYGQERGIIAFYYPGSRNGKRGAELIAEELKKVYPLPDQVEIRPTVTLGEVSRSLAPAVLVEIGYHDNMADALWIEGNRGDIARALAIALTRYFGLPFIEPIRPRRGEVDVEYGTLNLRAYPASDGEILANLPDGGEVMIYGQWQGWYVVHYKEWVGYAAAAYIET